MLKRIGVLFVLVLGFVSTADASVKRDTLQLSSELANLKNLQQVASSTATATATASASSTAIAVSGQKSQTSASATSNVSSSTSTAASSSATTDTSTEYNSGYPGNGEAWTDLPTSASFGNTIYAGSVSFVEPTKNSASVSPMYAIQSSANVTFKWAYTALRVRPVNITLDAVGPNSLTVDIATLDGSATEAVWNLGSVPTTNTLMNGYYKIQLYDQRGVSASISPGWMVPCTTMTIAFYTLDLYDPITTISGYCPTCFYSAAGSFRESIGPIAVAVSIAAATSILVLVNVLG